MLASIQAKKAQCFQDGPHQWFKVTSVRGWSCQCLKRLTVCGVFRAGQQTLDFVQASASTHTKIGSIQRRLAWPLRKDDTQIREAFRILLKSDCSTDPGVFFQKYHGRLTAHWRCRGLNSGPHTCEACALPLSYIPSDFKPYSDLMRKIKPLGN